MTAVGETSSIIALARTAKDFYDLMKSIQGAPAYILDVTEDVRVLQTITEQIEYDEHASSTQMASAVEVLAHCKLKMQRIKLLLEDLGLQTCSKRRRTWSSVKVVLRKEKIEALRKSLESAKSTLVMARGVFTDQATKREVTLLTTGMSNIRTQQATRESVSKVTEHVERVQDNLAYQQNSINTVIASQRHIEQHVTKIHLGIDQIVQSSCSTSDSLAQPFIHNVLKHAITEIVHEALQDSAIRRELCRIVPTPQEIAVAGLNPTSSNDSRDDLDRPATATATNSSRCYSRSQSASPRKRYAKRSVRGYFKIYKSIFGTVYYSTKIVHRQSYEDVSESSTWHELETIFTIIPAPWLTRFGFQFVSAKMFDTRSHSLRTFRTISRDALIFDFCSNGNVAGIRSLFQRRLASPFDRDETGRTPLHYAALHGGHDVCALLIQEGAPVDATDYSSGNTPFLMFAWLAERCSEIERITLARLFIEEGKTDLTLTNDMGRNFFHEPYASFEWAFHTEGNLFDPLQRVQRVQRDRYSRIESMFGLRRTIFKPKELKMLIEAGCDVNAKDIYGLDALYRGLLYGEVAAKLRVLLQAGAEHHRLYRNHTHTSMALGEPERFASWRDALLSLDEFDLINFLNAELDNGMPLWEDGWTIHSLCGIFLAPSAELRRQNDFSRLEFQRFARRSRKDGDFWAQWDQIDPWALYLNKFRERMRYELYLPHLGIVPKRKAPLVSPKPRRYLTLRKGWSQSLRQKCWNVYRSLPESLREYRVCTLPSVVVKRAPP